MYQKESIVVFSCNTPGEIALGPANALRQRGYPVDENYSDGSNLKSSDYDKMLLIGPMQPLTGFLNTKQNFSNVYVWLTEQLPASTPLTRSLAILRHKIDSSTQRHLPGRRYGTLGEMIFLSEQGATISSYSEQNQTVLQQAGIKSRCIIPGICPEINDNVDPFKRLENRSTDVTFIGSTNNRRGPIIDRLLPELQRNNITYQISDGQIGPVQYGANRAKLMVNSKINILLGRNPSDDHIYRLVTSGGHGMCALTVNNDLKPSQTNPFKIDTDFYNTSESNLISSIKFLLKNITFSQSLADNLRQKVFQYPMEQQAKKVLQL